MNIQPELPADGGEIESLYDRAFGETRHGKAVYRLREGVAPLAELCFTVRYHGSLKGVIRFWPVGIETPDKPIRPALLLGPIAVDPSAHREGYGRMLMHHGLSEARRLGHRLVILVGDMSWYGQFGFSNAHTAGLVLPGPVDQSRVLAHWLDQTQGGALIGRLIRAS